MPVLFVSDLDGTLLQEDHSLAAETIAAIRNLHDAGRTFAIATGRHHTDVADLAKKIDRPIGMISCNGGMAIAPNGDIIASAYIPDSITQDLVHHPMPEGVFLNMYTDYNWYATETNPKLEAYSEKAGFKCELVTPQFIQDKRAVKFFLWGDRNGLLALQAELKTKYKGQLDCLFSLPHCLELMPKGISKATAVDALCKHLNLTATHVMAFGDGENDIEMLQYAAHPKVMLNAAESVKAAVPHAEIIGHAHQLGVANYLSTAILANLDQAS
ncbi:HAD family hydrolase [Motilimonas sp. KMU-193]|uniref:HAD family hydrolase n=1 Tax=Motilimonas sp. KMU-193 TaxID=3388668 RepID=UPI00396B16F5